MPVRAPRHKTSRRLGFDVYGTGGPPLQRRLATPPGATQGRRRRRLSVYGQQLLEKQKVRALYGLGERQLRRLFVEAGHTSGPRGANLLTMLERRLDNAVYRLGFARTRAMARQLVTHGHVRVDAHRVTIPSYRLEVGETVGLSDAAARIPTVAEEVAVGRPLPGWLERIEPASGEPLRGRITRPPERSDIEEPVDESLVVAFYSR